MRLVVVAVGQRIPGWAQQAWDDYAKRFPPEIRFELRAVKTEARSSKSLATVLAAERGRIETAIAPGSRIVVLDEHGTALTTVALAGRLRQWQLWDIELERVRLPAGTPPRPATLTLPAWLR